MFSANEPYTDVLISNEEIVNKVSSGIVSRRLSVPAIFLLEMNKPLVGLFREGSYLAAPLLLAIVGSKLFRQAQGIISTIEGIESLIKAIEVKEAMHGS